MKERQMVTALGALAQEHRLATFRLLVQAGPEGMMAGDIAGQLKIPAPTLSFHLKTLRHAGLIDCERVSRNLLYRAQFDTMNSLIQSLTENCCAGVECVLTATEACK